MRKRAGSSVQILPCFLTMRNSATGAMKMSVVTSLLSSIVFQQDPIDIEMADLFECFQPEKSDIS